MGSRLPWISLLVSALALAAMGCTEEVHGPTSIEPQTSQLPSETSDALIELTRRVALVLGSRADVRTAIKDAMSESPYREGKLELSAILRSATLGLGDEVLGTSEFGPSISSAVQALPSFEVYLPIAEHRASWDGARDIVVASAIGEDGILAAFTTDGSPVFNLESTYLNRPLLVIVPAEVDFQRELPSPLVQNAVSDGRFDGPTMASGSGELLMTRMTLTDLHEPFYKGDPELQIHVLDTDDGAWVSCSGDDYASTSPYHFDQNNGTWVGSVRVATEAILTGEDLNLQVWENDSGARCPSNFEPKPDATTEFLVENWNDAAGLGALTALGGATWWQAGAVTVTWLAVEWFYQGMPDDDDFVGTITPPSGSCWASGLDPARLYLEDASGSALQGNYLELEESGIERNTCALEAQISGDTYACVLGDPSGTWSAQYAGGTGTPAYEWYEDGVLRGTSANYSLYNRSQGTRRIELVVTRDSGFDTDLRFVDVIDDESQCFF